MEKHTQVRSILPLVILRVTFGILMLVSLYRFWHFGWIDAQFSSPLVHFHGPLFSLFPIGEWLNYSYIFLGLALCSIGILLGMLYRICCLSFVVLFAFVLQYDLTYYLNHYYAIFLLSILLAVLPCHRAYSLDAKFGIAERKNFVPCYIFWAVQLFVAVIYWHAGWAKVQTDWLLHAQPLSIWLASKGSVPLIGPWITHDQFPILAAWFGCIYDLSIPFLLWSRSLKTFGFLLVLVFHLFTAVLFPIGMFPYIMIGISLIFVPDTFWLKVEAKYDSWLPYVRSMGGVEVYSFPKVLASFLALFVLFHIIFPFRIYLDSGNTLWTEQGFRFGWRVMLIEKSGLAQWSIQFEDDPKIYSIDNDDFLNAQQTKMMSTQPDLIWKYARILKDAALERGKTPQALYVDVSVGLNGRSAQKFLPDTLNILNVKDPATLYAHVLPLRPSL